MFRLNEWQQQIATTLTPPQQQLWQQIAPYVQQLTPTIEALQQHVVKNAQHTVQRVVTPTIVSAYGEPSNKLASIVPQHVEQLFNHTPQQLHKALQQADEWTSHIWLHGGVCVGDEQQLQQQVVTITCTYEQQTHIMEGAYVYCDAAQKALQELVAYMKVPFIADVYAQRFYILRIEKEAAAVMEHWPTIDAMHIAPLHHEETIQFHVHARPLWNVKVQSLQKKRGATQLISNAMRRQTFSLETAEQVTPILSSHSSICEQHYEEGTYEVTVEMPSDQQTLQAYVTMSLADDDAAVHTKCEAHVTYTLQAEPTMAELQQLTTMYSYLTPLQIIKAEAHVLPLRDDELMRKDALVLHVVVPQQDVYGISRCRALQQAVCHYWSYAACEVKQVTAREL